MYLVHGETADAGYLREFPQVSIQNLHFCEPQGPSFFLTLENEWNLPCMSKHSQGVHFFFFFFAHTIIKSVGMWVFPFLLSPLSDTLPSHPAGSFPFSTCWDVETGAKGRRLGGSVDIDSIKTCFPKALFPRRRQNSPSDPIVGSIPVPLRQDCWPPHSADPSLLCSSG